MADEKKGAPMQSFQIGNLGGGLPGPGPSAGGPGVGGPSVTSPTALATTQTSAEDAPSGIFPFLEELVERSDEEILAFGQEMGAICHQLDELIEKRTGRVKQEAQNARRAYDLTFDLIDYLREVKAGLLEEASAEENS